MTTLLPWFILQPLVELAVDFKFKSFIVFVILEVFPALEIAVHELRQPCSKIKFGALQSLEHSLVFTLQNVSVGQFLHGTQLKHLAL